MAILVRPGDVADLARQGSLLELSDVLGAAESEALAELPLAEVGRIGPPRIGAEAVEARQVGVPVAVTASSLLWYPAEAFASSGYEPPKTWSELDDLVSRMIADGRTPWCLGLIGGEHDGASGTDWVEDFVIDQLAAGPTDVDPARWPAFGHPFVKSALLRLHGSVSAPGAVLGGPGSAARTPSEWAAAQMGTGSEPRCWLVHGGTDERSRWIEPLRSDLTPILLPLGDPNHVAVRGRVYTLVVLRDRPEVRALVRHVLDAGLGSSMPFGDGATGILALGPAGGRSIPPEEDSLSASLAAALDSGRFWPDASDRMSRSLGLAAVPEAVLRVVGSDAVTAEAVAEYELEALARIGAPVLP